jgi:hypothetical protein
VERHSGLKRIDVTLGGALLRSENGSDPADVLKHIRAVDKPGVYVLLDFHPYLQDPRHVRLIKDIAQEYDRAARTLIFVSHALAVPPELEHLAARLEIAFPDEGERRTIVDEVVEEWQRSSRRRAKLERGASTGWCTISRDCRPRTSAGSRARPCSTTARSTPTTCAGCSPTSTRCSRGAACCTTSTTPRASPTSAGSPA